MAARYFLFHILFITSCLVAAQSPYYALKGETVSLRPDIAGHPDGILWKYNGNKVVEFNGREQEVYSPYENRITLGWDSAELDISGLRFEDSGDYELDVDINKRLHRSVYKLEVIDKVAEPTITCEMNDEGSSNTSGKLRCSAEPGQPQPFMKFEWTTHGHVRPGPQLQIPLGHEHDDEVYSCSVSNRLSSKTATFTAKECYPDESSSALLIAILVSVAVLLLVGLAAILYCKLRHKACFAKEDPEKRSPPGRTEESDKEKAQDDEKRALVHRASTLPSTQRLGLFFQGNGNMRPDEPASNQKDDTNSEPEINKQDETPKPGHVQAAKERLYGSPNDESKKPAFSPARGFSSPLDRSSLACDDNGDAEAEQHREPSEETEPQSDPSDSDKDNEPEPAIVSDAISEDAPSSPKSPISPEHPEPEKESDEDEEAHSAPADADASPAARPHSPLTESSPNKPKDTAGEHEEVANSDQVAGEPAEENVRESDSSGEEDRNESGDFSEDKPLSTVPEQSGSNTLLHEQDLNSSQEETNTSEVNQQEPVQPVSEEESKTESVGDHEETDRKQDLYSANSQQPRSPTPTKPDDRNTDTCQGSPATAHAHLDEEEEEEEEHKTGTDSDEPEGQSDKGEGETFEDKNEDQLDKGEGETVEDKNKVQSDKGEGETVENKNEVQSDKGEGETVEDKNEVQSDKGEGETVEDKNEVQSDKGEGETVENKNEVQSDKGEGETVEDKNEDQSDKGEGETVEDKNEVPCGLKGEEQGNESCSGGNAGQKKDEVVA